MNSYCANINHVLLPPFQFRSHHHLPANTQAQDNLYHANFSTSIFAFGRETVDFNFLACVVTPSLATTYTFPCLLPLQIFLLQIIDRQDSYIHQPLYFLFLHTRQSYAAKRLSVHIVRVRTDQRFLSKSP